MIHGLVQLLGRTQDFINKVFNRLRDDINIFSWYYQGRYRNTVIGQNMKLSRQLRMENIKRRYDRVMADAKYDKLLHSHEALLAAFCVQTNEDVVKIIEKISDDQSQLVLYNTIIPAVKDLIATYEEEKRQDEIRKAQPFQPIATPIADENNHD